MVDTAPAPANCGGGEAAGKSGPREASAERFSAEGDGTSLLCRNSAPGCTAGGDWAGSGEEQVRPSAAGDGESRSRRRFRSQPGQREEIAGGAGGGVSAIAPSLAEEDFESQNWEGNASGGVGFI